MTQNLRAYRPSDKEEILNLLGKVWGKEEQKSNKLLWDWKHARDEKAKSEGQLSLVSEKDGKITGYSGTVPVDFLLDGKNVAGCFALDICTDPAERGVGVRLIRRQIEIAGMVIGIAAPRSHALWKKLLKRDDMSIADAVKMVCPIDSGHFLKKTGIGFLHPVISPIWKFWVKSRLAIAMPKSGSTCRCETFERFTPAIADLWREFAKDYRFSIVHDLDWLNWRFCDCPYTYEKILIKQNNKNVGYFVYRKTTLNRRPIIIICEAVAVGNLSLHYAIIADHIIKSGIQANVSEIRTLDSFCLPFRQALKKRGFFSKKIKSLPIIANYFASRDPECEIYKKKGWLLWTSDADFEFALFHDFVQPN